LPTENELEQIRKKPERILIKKPEEEEAMNEIIGNF
jgi:hypothetical protein